MASVDVTIPDGGFEFEADDTQHTATLNSRGNGRFISNTGTKPAIVGFWNQAGLVLAQPAGADKAYLDAGSSEPIPIGTGAISFLSGAGASKTNLRISAVQ